MKLLSVIIPIYNAEKYLENVLRNLSRITFEDIEFICVNDGSEDASADIIKKYAKADNRFLVFEQQNKGVADARNRGIEMATGKYILFTDADDGFIISTLYRVKKELERSFELLIFPYLKYIDGREELYSLSHLRECKNNADLCRAALLSKEINACWSQIYSRQILMEHTIRFPVGIKMGEDLIFNFRYYSHIQSFQIMEYPLYIYQVHENSVSMSYDETRFHDLLAVYREACNVTERNLAAMIFVEDFFYYLKMELKFSDKQIVQDTLMKPELIDAVAEIAGYASFRYRRIRILAYFLKHKRMKFVILLYAWRGKLVALIKKIGSSVLRQYHKIIQNKDFLVRLHRSELKRLKKSVSKQRMLILDTPEHDNVGDHAIVCAQYRFLKDFGFFENREQFEFTHKDWKVLYPQIKEAVTETDIILLPGGGFIGNVWMEEETVLLDILQSFPQNPIIIFPQTIFFLNDTTYDKERERLNHAMRACSNLFVFARDKMTYDFLIRDFHMDRHSCGLAPDMVTYLTPDISPKRKKNILMIMREDKEKICYDFNMGGFQDTRLSEYRFVLMSTVVSEHIPKSKRKRAVYETLLKFTEASLIITDRLHGMLFSAITGTPCLALDNITNKVSGQYDWLRSLNYIRVIQSTELTENIIAEMLTLPEAHYDKQIVNPYFRQMADTINRMIREE